MLSPVKSFIILLTGFITISGINYLYLLKTDKEYTHKLLMNNIMGCIFIIFGLLKIVNLPKFVQIFNKYDIISQKIPYYGYIYPFIEISLGLAYLKKYKLHIVNSTTIFLMIISIISVVISMINGQKLRCGCLGSFLHIPLSYVTLSENVVMALMSASYFN